MPGKSYKSLIRHSSFPQAKKHAPVWQTTTKGIMMDARVLPGTGRGIATAGKDTGLIVKHGGLDTKPVVEPKIMQ